MLPVLVSLLVATPVVVNDADFDKSLSELDARHAAATTDGERYAAQQALEQALGTGLRRLDEALVKATQAAPTSAERREHAALRALLATLARRADLARTTEWLDLEGADVDPLERFVLVSDCAAFGLQTTALYQCVADWDQLDPTAARQRADALAVDPAARRLVGRAFDKRAAEVKAAFDKVLAGAPELDGVPAALARARAAFAAWKDEIEAPLGHTWRAARDVDERLILGLPSERFAGCDAELTPALEALVRALPPEPDEAVSALARSAASGIVVDAAATCAFATGRLHVGEALASYGSARTSADHQPTPRGPRAFASRVALAERSALRLWESSLTSRRTVDEASARFRGNLPRTHRYEGVIGALTKRGGAVQIGWKRVTIPDQSYSCTGSNRITGAYVSGGTIGLTRDVSCGYRVTGTVDVTPAPVILPAAATAHLAVGQRVTLELPYREGEVYDSDARYVFQIDGRTVRPPSKPETFADAFIVRAYDKAGKRFAVLLGVPLAAAR